MAENQKSKLDFFKSKEELVSMGLGLLIVLVVFGLLINYFSKKKSGNISITGITSEVKPSPITSAVAPTSKEIKTVKPTPVNIITNISGGEYSVIKGDSLWKIAERKYGSGYNWVDIARANKLNNKSVLAVGQRLVLPDVQKRVALSPKKIVPNLPSITGNEYTIVKGDNLSLIALRAYGDSFAWTRIWQANKPAIGNPNLIHAGNKLVIPR